MSNEKILISAVFTDAQMFNSAIRDLQSLKIPHIDLVFRRDGLHIWNSVQIGINPSDRAIIELHFEEERIFYKYNTDAPEVVFRTTVLNLTNNISSVKAVDALTLLIYEGSADMVISKSISSGDPSSDALSRITNIPSDRPQMRFTFDRPPRSFSMSCSSIIDGTARISKNKAPEVVMKVNTKGMLVEGSKSDHSSTNVFASDGYVDEEALITDIGGLSLVDGGSNVKRINTKTFESLFSLVTLYKKGTTRFHVREGGRVIVVGDIGTMGQSYLVFP